VVPEQADQVEEAAGVQAEDCASARLLSTGAALRVAVRAALLLPGGSCVCCDLLPVQYRGWSSKLRLRFTAADDFGGARVSGTRDGRRRTSSRRCQNGTATPSPPAPSPEIK